MADNTISGTEAQGSANDALLAEIAALRAENAALAGLKKAGLTLKVSEKGGVSLYGLGRFPVTLYQEQWQALLDFVGAPEGNPLAVCIAANQDSLTTKAEAKAEAQAKKQAEDKRKAEELALVAKLAKMSHEDRLEYLRNN